MKKILVLMIGMSMLTCGCSKKEIKTDKPVKTVKTVIVKTASTSLNRDFPGIVKSSKKTDLSFKNTGRLINLPIKEGQPVYKGQILAKLDPDKNQYNLESAQAQFSETQAAFNRYKSLYEQGIVSTADYQLKKKNFEVAKSSLSLAQKSLKDTVLIAPFSGVITRKTADNHEFINAKETIAILQDLNCLEIEINIPERLMISNAKSFSYTAEFENYPNRKFPLKLKSHSKQKDKMTNTYLATFFLKNIDEVAVLPDMTVTVTIKSNVENNSNIEIPVNAVFSDSDKKQYVWTVNNENIAVKTPVKIKEFLNNKALISSGLENNVGIIVSGVHHILEGDKIKEYERLDLDK